LSDPTNEKVSYTSTYIADLLDNEFANGATDGFGYLQNIEFGVDTSIDLILGVSYYVKGTGTGDIDFDIESTQVMDGFIYNGTYGDALTIHQQYVETISSASDLLRKSFTVRIPINKLSQGDGVVINIKRLGGSATDTLSNNIVITNVVIDGFYWS
jgi:hypothetical protein